jgi:8-amino-7-oxononanoate synthase
VFKKELRELDKKGLLRNIISRASKQGPVININGRQFINFSSNDYLGLAGHQALSRASAEAAKRFGSGAGASRLLAGGTILHERLEEQISGFKGCESALIFNSGYAANSGIIPAIASEEDVIFSDELNHASIIDGCRLSKAKSVLYRHKDIDHLAKLLKKEKARRRIVITDSVFSMDGDIAPLGEIAVLCGRHDAVLYVDDAHGTGVLGSGRGALAHFGVRPAPWILQMGTFSKALGSFGAFIAGGKDMIRWILNKARSLIFSTALPPTVVAASLTALLLLEKRPSLVKRLWRNREKLVIELRTAGYDLMESETPIIPLRIGDVRETLRLSAFLYENGIYAPAIRPPAVREPRLRLTVTAAHTQEHISYLMSTLRRFAP